MGQVENNARYRRQLGYKILEDIDVSQSDFQTLLDELTDAKNSLVQQNGYMPKQSVFGMIHLVPGHLLEENPDPPNLDPEGRFRKIAEMRHKCRMAAIDRGECEDQKKFDWTIVTYARRLRAWRSGVFEVVYIKHKVNGWDQFGSLELKEEMFGCHTVRQLFNVRKSSYVWHHPQSERCEKC